MYLGFPEQSKIATLAVGECRADNLPAFFVNRDLCFYGVSLFLAGIPPSLPLFGRSTGVSVVSIRRLLFVFYPCGILLTI
jgi:hypothetical protein